MASYFQELNRKFVMPEMQRKKEFSNGFGGVDDDQVVNPIIRIFPCGQIPLSADGC
jgi:hypothetical protein